MLRIIVIRSLVALALFASTPALASAPYYSTDGDEVDIASLKKDTCCMNDLKRQANVRLDVKRPVLGGLAPVTIEVRDANNQQLAKYTTHDKVVYIALPEGKYTLQVSTLLKKKTIPVVASDEVIKNFSI